MSEHRICPLASQVVGKQTPIGVVPETVFSQCLRDKCAMWRVCPANSEGMIIALLEKRLHEEQSPIS